MEDNAQKKLPVADNVNTADYSLRNSDSAPIDDKSHTVKLADSSAPDINTYHKDNE